MPFEKEIKLALKIGDDWIGESKSFEVKFVDIKKTDLKLVKDELAEIQKAIAEGHKPEVMSQHKAGLGGWRKFLESKKQEGEKLFSDHSKWSLDEPRESMRFIDKKLKLGGFGSPAYTAVTAACKRQLTEVATAISATEKVWTKDVLFALETQLDRLAAIEKILLSDVSATKAYMEQIKVEAARFTKSCDDLFNALKTSVAVNSLADLLTGKDTGGNEDDASAKLSARRG